MLKSNAGNQKRNTQPGREKIVPAGFVFGGAVFRWCGMRRIAGRKRLPALLLGCVFLGETLSFQKNFHELRTALQWKRAEMLTIF
jgi:hypothetical protein